MRSTVTVLHLADLHFDSAFSSMNGEEASKLNAKIRNIFKAAVSHAKKVNTDIILLSGDLFDREYYSRESIELLRSEMEGFPQCRFIIAPGNHDPYTSESPYKKESFPSNCYIFNSESITCFSFPELNTDVYGFAFTSAEYKGSPLLSFQADNNERLNLLCAHGNTPDTGVAPGIPTFTPLALSQAGIDYAALGHIHTNETVKYAADTLGIAAITPPNANTAYAYAGCIAGRDFGECGRKGGILLNAEFGEAAKKLSMKRLAFCPWVYRDVTVDITGINDIDDIIEKISSNIPNEGDLLEQKLRLTLIGAKTQEQGEDPYEFLEVIRELMGLSDDAELRDMTTQKLNVAELESDYTLKGVFYRLLKEDLSSSDKETKARANYALNLGICALDGGNPWDINE